MLTGITILIAFVCVVLMAAVLIQNPKGGGLVSGFAGTNTLMGVKRTGDILEKGTWVLVIAIMVFSLLVNVVDHSTNSGGSTLQNEIVPTSAPATNPTTLPSIPPQDSTK